MMLPTGIDIARILGEGRERLGAPDAADQLVPGQAEGLDPHPELRVHHDPLLEQGTEAGAIGGPPGARGGKRELHRLGGQHDQSGAQRRIREGLEQAPGSVRNRYS